MKMRVLSVLLAAGMLLGGSTGGYSAAAVGSLPQMQRPAVSEQAPVSRQNAPDGQDTAPETTAPADTVEAPEEVAVVRLRSAFPKDSVFTGQEGRYWDPETGFVLPDYYRVRIDGKEDDGALGSFRIAAVFDKTEQLYRFAAEKPAVTYKGKDYTVSFEDEDRTVALKEYDPLGTHRLDWYQDVRRTNDNGTIKLEAQWPFQIAADADPASFKGQSVTLSSLKSGSYYLRNNDSNDKTYYQAISKAYSANQSVKPELSEYAVIKEDVDLSKQSALNTSLTVTVTGYAMAESATLELYNNGEKEPVVSAVVDAAEGERDSSNRNVFHLTYTFDLSRLKPKNRFIQIQNLKAVMTAEGNSATRTLSLKDSRQNTKSSFILDGDAPVVVYEKEGKLKEWNYVQFAARDYEKDDEKCSGLQSVSYSFDGQKWADAELNFNEGMKKYVFWVDSSVTKTNGKVRIQFRVRDLAGNENYVSQDENGDWLVVQTDCDNPVIEEIQVLYRDAAQSDEWLSLTDSVLSMYPYGTFAHVPLQFRIWAHDPEPADGEASGIASVTVGGQECKPPKLSGDIPQKLEDGTEYFELVTGYYSCELTQGEFRDFKVTVTDNGRNEVSRSLREVLAPVCGDAVQSDHLFLDSALPELQVTPAQYVRTTVRAVSEEETETTYLYGKNALEDSGKHITVKCSDTDGIAMIDVTIDGVRSEEYSRVYTGNDALHKLEEYEIPVSAIPADGKHRITVTVLDNAGNPKTETVLLNLDYHEPEVTDFFNSIGEADQDWCRSDKLPVLTLHFKDANPARVEMSVNNSKKTFDADSLTADGADGYTVTLDLAKDLDDAQMPFLYDREQVFRISGAVYDIMDNQSSFGEMLIHVDAAAPVIDRVDVEQTETATEKVLRVLTFGIFSNEKFQYTVQATDQQNDSGIALLEIQLEPEGEFYPMSYSAAFGNYSYVIPKGDPDYELVDKERFEGVTVIRATDKVGRVTTVFSGEPAAEGNTDVILYAEDQRISTKENAFMLETIAPEITVEMPASDSETRTADRWYTLRDADQKRIHVTASDPDSGLYEVRATLTVQVKQGFQTVPQSKEYVLLSSDSVQHLNAEDYKLNKLTELPAEFDLETLFRDLPPEADGRCEFTVTAVDLAGNSFTTDPAVYYMDWKTPEVLTIDLTPETADRYDNTGDYPGSDQFVNVLEYGFYFHEPFTATVNVRDEGPSSGMDRISYRLVEYQGNSLLKEGALQYAAVDRDGKASFRIPSDFKGQIFVSAYDNVGNTPEAEVTPHSFVVDTPTRHDAEEHISISGLTQTSYRDGAQHPLYTGAVTLTVRITDTMSGIRNIVYAMDSEQNQQEERTIELANTGYREGQALGDGWTVTKMDENLVTEVTRVYSFDRDDNSIRLSFRMTDRSNNSSAKESDIFSIDMTAPVIQVAFQPAAGNGAYYSQKRSATVTVTERNFDAARIRTEISNQIGGTPAVSFRDISDTEHIAELVFDEGDYRFAVSGTDLCDHTANVTYSGGHETAFYVDLKDPVVVTNFGDLTNSARNSFRGDQKVTFSITEHNFVKDSVRIRVERAASGKELNSSNREDCTSEFVTRDMWTDNGDVHTAGFTFSKDAVYRVSVSVTDAAGRSAADAVSPIFEVDKKKPVLDTPADLSRLVYTKKSTQTEADPITFTDENIDRVTYSVVSYRLKRDADQVGYGMDVSEPKQFEVKSGTVVLDNDYFRSDGIYEVKCVAYDVAGNPSAETTHTFVVQRDSDFLVYIPESSRENKTGLYKFNQIGIRSADFEDIRVIAYVTADKEFSVQVDGEDVTGEDVTVTEITGDALGGGKKSGETINQIKAYDLTLRNSYISQKYSDETIDTDLLLNAVAATPTEVQKITLGHIYIDNVKPVGEYEAALQNLGFFGGFYGMDSRSVRIEGVSPDINLERSEIQINDTVLKAGSGGFTYDEDAHAISFTLSRGYTDIKTTLVDNAGNTYNLPVVKKVYVGGLFSRFWYLFILGGLVLISVPALIIYTALKKKKAGSAY